MAMSRLLDLRMVAGISLTAARTRLEDLKIHIRLKYLGTRGVLSCLQGLPDPSRTLRTIVNLLETSIFLTHRSRSIRVESLDMRTRTGRETSFVMKLDGRTAMIRMIETRKLWREYLLVTHQI